jgi:hypothetical protein
VKVELYVGLVVFVKVDVFWQVFLDFLFKLFEFGGCGEQERL